MEVRVGGEEHLDGEDEEGATDDVEGEGSLRCSAGEAGLHGEDDGGSDEEEEVGKDEVREGEAVPGGVVELGVGVGPVAGVVDEDHEGDGEAAEDVDGEDTWWGRDGLRWDCGGGLECYRHCVHLRSVGVGWDRGNVVRCWLLVKCRNLHLRCEMWGIQFGGNGRE